MINSPSHQDKQKLWEFPCDFTFKAMTQAIEGIENNIISVIQSHVPGNYHPILRESKNGKYISVTVSIYLTSKSQLDKIYKDVYAVEGVKMLL